MEDVSILVAKATTMRDGIKVAIDLEFKHIVVEGAYKLVIQSIRAEVKIPWQIQTIIDDIRISTKHQVSIGNMAVDCMAKYACSSQASILLLLLFVGYSLHFN